MTTAKGYQLAEYILWLDNFRITKRKRPEPAYQHMGALIVDSVLQAGLNYRTVVWPRVERVLKTYPQACTTSTFHTVICKNGEDKVMQWRHPEKPRRMIALIAVLMTCQIETVDELQDWLLLEESSQLLIEIKGIGNKTVDYIRNLAGLSTVAVDRHIRHFVIDAGITCSGYDDYQDTVKSAAKLLSVSAYDLDKAIWEFYSCKIAA